MAKSPAAIFYDSAGTEKATGSNPVAVGGLDDQQQVRTLATLSDGTVKVVVGGRQRDMVTGKLFNGTNFNMAVNGSATPVNFQFQALTDYNLLLSQLRFVFVPNVLKVDNLSFGAFLALANGVRVAVTENGIEHVLGLLKQSEDIFAFSCGIDPIIEVNLTANDMVVFGINFAEGMKLYAGTADKVEVRIQDNLTNQGAAYLRHFSATLIGVKEI